MTESLPIILYLAVICGVPPLTIWGWIRWARSTQPRTWFSDLSLAGFALSTLAALLAIATVLYAQFSGGFRYYDPVLIDIYGVGLVVSIIGLACALIGVLRPSPLRWHAPICSLGMFIFWMVSAARE